MNKSFAGFVAAMSLLSTLSFGSAPAGAQGADERGPATAGMPCPNPIVVTLTRGGSTAATPNIADFPSGALTGFAYNQTAANHNFRDTIAFKKPDSKCCQFRPGKLTVVYKALQGGTVKPRSGGDAGNDSGGLVHHGASVSGQSGYIWALLQFTGNTVHPGDTVPIVYTVSPSIIASGQVSFAVQDDTAVVSAKLEISGCCLEPTPAS